MVIGIAAHVVVDSLPSDPWAQDGAIAAFIAVIIAAITLTRVNRQIRLANQQIGLAHDQLTIAQEELGAVKDDLAVDLRWQNGSG